jgi:hypothetical protein
VSIRVLDWALKEADMVTSPTHKLVLIVLADCASDDGTEAFPAVSTIVKRSCLSERTVRSSLRALEDLGVIGGDRRPGARTHYRIHTSTPAALAGVQPPQGAALAGDPGSSRRKPLQLSPPNRKEASSNRQGRASAPDFSHYDDGVIRP